MEDYRRYVKLAPEATDIGDEYLRTLSPKVWEKVEKERTKAQEEAVKAVEEKKAARKQGKEAATEKRTLQISFSE